MNNFGKHRADDNVWYSPPFYSGPQGYKMRLLVYANGRGAGEGTHVSVYVQIIQGQFDDILTWPYKGSIAYEIINWKDDKAHIIDYIVIDFTYTNVIDCGKRPEGENSNVGFGSPQIIRHSNLYGPQYQYVYNAGCNALQSSADL